MMKIYVIISICAIFLLVGCNNFERNRPVFSIKHNIPKHLKEGKNEFSFDISNLTDKTIHIKEKTINKSCIILYFIENIDKKSFKNNSFMNIVYSSSDIITKDMHYDHLPKIELCPSQTIKIDNTIYIDLPLNYKSGRYDIRLEISFYYIDPNNSNAEVYFLDRFHRQMVATE